MFVKLLRKYVLSLPESIKLFVPIPIRQQTKDIYYICIEGKTRKI